jgi:hypothetical protein
VKLVRVELSTCMLAWSSGNIRKYHSSNKVP